MIFGQELSGVIGEPATLITILQNSDSLTPCHWGSTMSTCPAGSMYSSRTGLPGVVSGVTVILMSPSLASALARRRNAPSIEGIPSGLDTLTIT